MVPLIGRLYRRDDVVTSVYGRPLVGESPIGIVKAHRSTRRVDETELPVTESLAILTELDAMTLSSASVDLADLAARHRADPLGTPLREFLDDELFLARGAAPHDGPDGPRPAPRDVVLYGFGRIGRMLARILLERAGEHAPLALRAVVVRRRGPDDLVKRASLLRRDSIHGPFAGTVTVDPEHDTITANGTLIQFLSADAPSAVDYRAHGIEDAIVVDTTGRWRDAEGLEQHLLAPGAARVLLTAPGTGGVPNVVHGINHDQVGDAPVVSAASCTTNAIVPVLKAVSDAYGVVHGHVETVHSATNDQNLVDNYHPADRRGRAAGLNMVITATGAARAAEKALPELRGRLTGNAVRVPTPNVSLAVLHLTLARPVTRDALNGLLRDASLTSSLRRQIDYVESPEVVSTDFLGSRRAGVVDGLATIADGSEHVVLYVWYDNESGYSRQVHRILQEMAGGRPTALPATPAGRRAAARPAGGSLQTCGTSERSVSTSTGRSDHRRREAPVQRSSTSLGAASERVDRPVRCTRSVGVLLLVAVATAVLLATRAEAPWAPAIAILRGAAQLAVISLVLSGIIRSPVLIAVALVVMFSVAVVTAARRLGTLRESALPVAVSMALGIVVTGAVVFGTGAIELSPRYALAVGGIVIGNAMTIATISGRRFRELLVDQWDTVEGWLALGAPPRRATEALVRRAVSAALVPTVDQTKTTGLVTLPGAFVGAVFGGLSPLEAGRFQIVVLAAIATAGPARRCA